MGILDGMLVSGLFDHFQDRTVFLDPDGDLILSHRYFGRETIPTLLITGNLDGSGWSGAVHGFGATHLVRPQPVAGELRVADEVVSEPGWPLAVADLHGDHLDDIVMASWRPDRLVILLNRTLADRSVRRGSVNAGRGETTDVLFLNGSAGAGDDRIVHYPVLDPFRLDIVRPPAADRTRPTAFVVYAWTQVPGPDTIRTLPFRMGSIGLPVPMTGGEPQPQVIWNAAGRGRHLGVSARRVRGAPSTFFSRQHLRRARRFYIQGLIEDPGSSGEVEASVTNGIQGIPVVSR